MDKLGLRDAWLSQIQADLDALAKSQQATQAGATHAESQAEHAKDTRALESSYLARGLAERVVDLQKTLVAAANMELKTFTPESPIAVSALFTLRDQQSGTETKYFLTSVAGGIRLAIGDNEILTLTPAAPLGAAVRGLLLDDEVKLNTRQGLRHYLISELC